MKLITTAKLLAVALITLIAGNLMAAEAPFEGRKKCSSCHKAQAKSWNSTAHASAMKSLEPNVKKEAKIKAKLDPAKDYTQDKDCVGCHVDGFNKKGGYNIDAPNKMLAAVGCESCHGAGRQYRGDHRKAGQTFEKSGKTTPRKTLADKGQDFHLKKAAMPAT